MRYLWLTTAAMVACGVVIVVASQAAGWGPIAFIAGLLLLWSGLVKVIVLRIWRATLASRAADERSATIASAPAPRSHLP